MPTPSEFEIADFGGDTDDVTNSQGSSLYKTMTLEWSKPILWRRGHRAPDNPVEDPCVYAILRSHGNMTDGRRIEYIGLTRRPRARFANHATGRRVVKKYGEVHLVYAPVPVSGRNWETNQKRALEEIEHLLIWATWRHLVENERKLYTLPGMGQVRGNAWHIYNVGFPSELHMPKEIIYPWMLVR